jgi:PiT family inorganic phosphate transporter
MEQFLHDIAEILGHPYVALIILTALAFDFVNGFHDAANSIATIVGTRVLKPFHAVLWAAFWNFAAMWFFKMHVANTVAKLVNPEFITLDVIFAGLVGATTWNLITWWGGLPSSSSHALLGGLCGSAVAHAMKFVGVMNYASMWKTVRFIAYAPLIGLALGIILITILLWTLRRVQPRRVDKFFRVIQLGSAALFSLGHGSNDAQKTMGIIAALLYASLWKDKAADFQAGVIPHWIVLACFLTMGLGTMAGGWRIVKTMGMKITKLRPHGGAAAEVAAAATLFAAAHMGVPVSTTHTISGAIMGVGSVQRISAVRWSVARSVLWAWVLTIPAAAFMGAGCLFVIKLIRAAF